VFCRGALDRPLVIRRDIDGKFDRFVGHSILRASSCILSLALGFVK
jgi:hypothetical protein